MPKNRMEPTPSGIYIKKELNVTPEQDQKLSLLASLMKTTRSGALRMILEEHLQDYIDVLYDKIRSEWKPVKRKR